MGDRTYVRFVDSEAELSDPNRELPAIYLHWGGYPKYMKEVFNDFFEAVERDCANNFRCRYGDPTYLAAKFVVHMASEFAEDPTRPLDFTSVGITSVSVLKAVSEGSWTYAIVCSGGPRSNLRPKIMMDETLSDASGSLAYHSIEELDEVILAHRKNEEEENDA